MAAAAAVTGRLTDVRTLIALTRHGTIHRPRCRRAADRAAERRHRPDRAGALPAEAALRRLRRLPVPRPALPARRPREPGLRAQPAGVSRCAHRRRRTQFRLRLVARARGLGAPRPWHPRRDRADLRRHLRVERAEERLAAGGARRGRRRRAAAADARQPGMHLVVDLAAQDVRTPDGRDHTASTSTRIRSTACSKGWTRSTTRYRCCPRSRTTRRGCHDPRKARNPQ